jgi:hypothetical protein
MIHIYYLLYNYITHKTQYINIQYSLKSFILLYYQYTQKINIKIQMINKIMHTLVYITNTQYTYVKLHIIVKTKNTTQNIKYISFSILIQYIEYNQF